MEDIEREVRHGYMNSGSKPWSPLLDDTRPLLSLLRSGQELRNIALLT